MCTVSVRDVNESGVSGGDDGTVSQASISGAETEARAADGFQAESGKNKRIKMLSLCS